MEKNNKYTITEIAQKLNVSEAALRKYEKDYDVKVPRNEMNHRYYTEKELEVFQQIIKLKEQGANIHVIKKILDRSVSREEQNEQALELVTIDKLTGAELKNLLAKQIAEIVIAKEEELDQKFKEHIDTIKDEIREEIRAEFTKHQQQMNLENSKLVDAITKLREEPKKSFFKRMFG